MKIAFVTNQYKETLEALRKIQKAIENKHVIDQKNPDMVICIGGDGTLLWAVEQYGHMLDKVKFAPFHTGTLGFYSDFQVSEINEFIDALTTKKPKVFTCSLIKATVNKRSVMALNEITVQSIATTAIIDVKINKHHLETFRGNGLIISTQSGSTAYNKSVDGAIIWPSLEVMQMAEIAGINNNVYASLGNSVVMSLDDKIELTVLNDNSILTADRQRVILKKGDSIKIGSANKKVKIAHYKDTNFTNRLQKAFIKNV